MKTAVSVALGLSLTANAVLLAVFTMRPGFNSLESDQPANSANESTPSSDREGGQGQAGAGQTLPNTNRSETIWQSLRSDDLRLVVANLRTAGFPENIVRTIASALINERYAARRRELFDIDGPVPPFWDTTQSSIAYNTEVQSKLRELNRQRQLDLIDLLGELPIDEMALYTLRRQYGDLPPEKLTLL